MDGMASECVPQEVEEKMSAIESQTSSLSGLLREHGLEAAETPIYIALDEIRDEIQAETENEEREEKEE
jgi:hypothetical protein